MNLSSQNHKEFYNLRLKVTSLRNVLKQQRIVIEQQLKELLFKQFEEWHWCNFAIDKAAFIASSLNCTKHSIILNHAMAINDAGQEILLLKNLKLKLLLLCISKLLLVSHHNPALLLTTWMTDGNLNILFWQTYKIPSMTCYFILLLMMNGMLLLSHYLMAK